MGRSRSRSRSPRRDRGRRSRSRERRDKDKDRRRADREHHRSRSRSRSPRRSRRSHSHESEDPGSKKHQMKTKPQITEADLEGKSEEEIEMMKVMGFCGFDTTKNKKQEGNDSNYAANIIQKRRYRQYMNRRGGFNRPLDHVV